MPPAFDRISILEGDLLCVILSKLPIKDAVKCSVLSKRWRDLYKQIPQLFLSPADFPVNPDEVNKIIFNTLLFHGVEDLTLSLRFPSPMPSTLFSCTRLTTLRLADTIMSHIPANFSGFNHLVTCEFFNVEFRSSSLTSFISHCPLIEKLSVFNYRGLPNITISAPSITDLWLSFHEQVDLLTVSCPKLRALTFSSENPIKDFRLNRLLFRELSYSVRNLEWNSESNAIEKLRLHFGEREACKCNFSAEEFLEIVGTLKLLKKLDIYVSPVLERRKEKGIPLLNLFQKLPHLEHLRMRGMFVLELVTDQTPASANTHFVNLQTIGVEIDNFDENEMAVLGSLLESAPALRTMKVRIRPIIKVGKEEKCLQFLAKISYWRRASSEARVCVKFA